MDQKNTGKISLQELSFVFSSINIHLTKTQIQYYTNEIFNIDIKDTDQDNRIFEFCHFVGLIVAITTECVSNEDFIHIFNEFDKDKDGFITKKDLKALLMRLGDDVTDDDVTEMMKEADQDGDGMVSLNDFVSVIKVTKGTAPIHENDEFDSDKLLLPPVINNENNNCNKARNRKFSVLSLFSNDGCNLEVLETIILRPDNIKNQKNVLKRARVFLKSQFKKRFFKSIKN